MNCGPLPGDCYTAAHAGLRTATHKLLHYRKQDAYELFDLVEDPQEQRNLLHGDGAQQEEIAARFAAMKQVLQRLQQDFGDTKGRFAEPSTWPTGGVHGPWTEYQALGVRSVAEAIALAGAKLLLLSA
jgi:hypothetical protein